MWLCDCVWGFLGRLIYPPLSLADHVSTNHTTIQTCGLQSVNIGLMAWPTWKSLCFFQRLSYGVDLCSNIWTPPKFFFFFLQNLHGVTTLSPQLYFWKSILQKQFFLNINAQTNFYTFSPNLSKNQSNICDLPIFWLWMICLFTCGCTKKLAEIMDL